MMHQLIKLVSIALAAFIISYLVADVVARFGLDTATWTVGALVIFVTLVILFGLMGLFHVFTSKRAE